MLVGSTKELRPSSAPFAAQGGPGSSGPARRSRGIASRDPWRKRPDRPLPRRIHRGPREPGAGPITRDRIPSESRPHPASPAADIDTGGSTGSGLPASYLAPYFASSPPASVGVPPIETVE